MVDVASVPAIAETEAWPTNIPALQNGWRPTGGPVNPASDGGLLNWPLQQLANRTRYDHQRLLDAGLMATVPRLKLAGSMDTVTFTGWRAVLTDEAATVGTPAGTAGMLLTEILSPQDAVQTFSEVRGSGRKWQRYLMPSGGWSRWFLIYNAKEALGSVGFNASGDPSGALFEKGGSAANGYYVKFASGEMICRHQVDFTTDIATSFIGGFRSSGSSWTYPSTDFVAAPVVTASPVNNCAMGVILTTAGRLSASFCLTAVASQTSAARSVHLIAVGRWSV